MFNKVANNKHISLDLTHPETFSTDVTKEVIIKRDINQDGLIHFLFMVVGLLLRFFPYKTTLIKLIIFANQF